MSDRPEPPPDEPDDQSASGEVPELDGGADTGSWQAFAQADQEMPQVSGGRSPTAFRLLTLLAGLAVLAGLVWLLLQ